MSGWAQVHRDHIARCLIGGMTASQIMDSLRARFGLAVTRNAVIGLIHRDERLRAIGLSGAVGRRPARMDAAAGRAAARPVRLLKPKRRTFAERPALPLEPALPLVPAEPRPLIEQDGPQCRFPVGRDARGYLYCSAPVIGWKPGVPGGCYCPHHRALARGRGTRSERTAVRAAKRYSDW